MFPKDESNVTCGEQPKASFKKHTYTPQREGKRKERIERRNQVFDH